MSFSNLHDQKPNLPKGVVSTPELKHHYDVNNDDYLVIKRSNAIDIPLDDNDALILTGDEEFVIGRLSHKLPNTDGCLGGKTIHITINAKQYVLNKAKIAIEHLRALAGASPTDGVFAEIPNRADEPLHHVHTLVVQDGDAFITVPCGNVGDTYQVSALERDLQLLQKQYPDAYLQVENNQSLVIIPNIKLPSHWNVEAADILFPITEPYPHTGLDMFWVGTHLRLRNNAVPTNAIGFDRQYLGRNWHGFSWHYLQPWTPGRDNLVSHLRFVLVRLSQDR